MHIAQIGTGRVGRPTAYSILSANIVDKITVCDIKPGLAKAFAEELGHVTSSIKQNVEIIHCENSEEVKDADIILISAGKPRLPGSKINRRDLAIENAKIVKRIAEELSSNNPKAKYVVITNPVDAMAMVFKKYSKADFVISTGTNLESLRFRYGLSKILKVPVSDIQGWIGGEHGIAAIPLWSITKIKDSQIDKFLLKYKLHLDKKYTLSYVKSVSKLIIDNIGGTEYGPAASFRDIVRAIIKDSKEILSIAAPVKFRELPEPVHIGIPTSLGNAIGPSMFSKLSIFEKQEICTAAKQIFETYRVANENIKK